MRRVLLALILVLSSYSLSLATPDFRISDDDGDILNVNSDGTVPITVSGSITTAGGWTDDGTDVRLTTSSDNVGIGTTTPAASLNISTTASQNLFRVDDNGPSDTSPFVISSTGSVGIGTTTPVSQVHISGGANDPSLRWTKTGLGETATDGFVLGMWGDGGPQLWSFEDQTMRFGVNNSEKMTILKTSGYIGIGTASPDQMIHANIGTGFGSLKLDGSTGGCIMLRDTDDAGWTECKALDGTLSCATDADGLCD